MSCVLEALNSISNKTSIAPPKPATSQSDSIKSITPENVRLTQYASGLGCACKMKAPALMEVLHNVKKTLPAPPNLLVGYDKADDASVYKLTKDIAIVNTTDFFPPIVDNPRDYGRIAAANALSDIYAMGGSPITALSISTFPTSRLPLSVMTEIIQGAEEVVSEAGCVIAGGHTLDLSELIFGLAVTGVVNPTLFKPNGSINVRDGDVLILTKPIGTGVVTSLLKKGKIAKTDDGVEEVINSMSSLNKKAAEVFCSVDNNQFVHALTDITGFGLAGHLSELVASSSAVDGEVVRDVVIANINVDKLHFFRSAIDGILRYGVNAVPGGSISNAAYAGASAEDGERDSCSLRWCVSDKHNKEHLKCLVVDPQTSGGLLAVVQREKVNDILEGLEAAGVHGRAIGEMRRFNGENSKRFLHSRYVVVTDDKTKEGVYDSIDSSMNLFDIMSYLVGNNSNKDTTSTDTTQSTMQCVMQPVVGVGTDDMRAGGHTSTTLLVRGTSIGSEDKVLGTKLLLAHLAKLSQRESIGTVKRIVFMNTGVRIPLGLEDPRYTAVLKGLEARGIDICVCGTCLDHYAYTQSSLVCGRVSSADENINFFGSPTESVVTIC